MSANGKHRAPASLEFDEVAPLKIPVRIGPKHYVLNQAMAGDVILYRNFIVRTTRVSATDRTASSQGYADSEPYLLSLCMREVEPGGREVPVSIHTIKRWPNDILNKLFQTCQEISDMLDEEDESEEALVKKRDDANEKLAEIEERKKALTYQTQGGEPSDAEIRAHNPDSADRGGDTLREQAVKN